MIVIMPLLCYIGSHLFYIAPVLEVWRHATSQTGELDSGTEKVR